MRRIGRDPAQSTRIILTTVTDAMGFTAFGGPAVMFQQLLREPPNARRKPV